MSRSFLLRATALLVFSAILNQFAVLADEAKGTITVDGETWEERHDAKSSRTYFENVNTKEVTWYDPRKGGSETTVANPDGGPESFYHKGVLWQIFYDEGHKQNFYYNTASQQSLWSDPRQPRKKKGSKNPSGSAPPPPGGYKRPQEEDLGPPATGMTATIVLVPITLFLAALGGRIYYLETNFPEMLHPQKERKTRKKGFGVQKYKMGSNRMSQDGKGGRSANS